MEELFASGGDREQPAEIVTTEQSPEVWVTIHEETIKTTRVKKLKKMITVDEAILAIQQNSKPKIQRVPLSLRAHKNFNEYFEPRVVAFIYTKLEDFNIKRDQAAFAEQDMFLLENQLPYPLLMLLMSSSNNHEGLKRSIKIFVDMRESWMAIVGRRRRSSQRGRPAGPTTPSSTMTSRDSALSLMKSSR
ncbi:hypothetical protein C1H46_008546 [Malus baccata]|uniref:Uncharacterized protein n=1 Tax=Malus baccata TaxID=106549 RepID=A0A540N5N4_MALBA|nr:hypothetical protein C1H46_008546 [Malus baccata]